MSNLTETERLTIRNTILSTLLMLDQKDAALATALSHTLAPVVARIVADAEFKALGEGSRGGWLAGVRQSAEAIEAAMPPHGGSMLPHSSASDCPRCGMERALRIVAALSGGE